MKYIILILGLMGIFSSFAKTDKTPYFPLNLTPESTQNLRAGLNKGEVNMGVELSMHGDQDKNWLEKTVGDWSDFDHSFSVAYQTEDFGNSIIYGSVHVSLAALDSVGVGLKQIVFYETDKDIGNRLKGETTLFAFYQLPNKNLLFKGEQEYLSFYIGFKSDISNFEKDHISEIVDNSLDMWEVSDKMIGGVFYSPDVTAKTFRGISMEINGKGAYFMALHISV